MLNTCFAIFCFVNDNDLNKLYKVWIFYANGFWALKQDKRLVSILRHINFHGEIKQRVQGFRAVKALS